jgi:hypothetical protein
MMYVGLGVAAIWFSRNLAMGSAMRMGPAYVPNILAGLLILLGAAALCRSLVVPGERLGAFAWREALLVIAAVVLFGLLLAGAGFVVASVSMVMLGAYAGSEFRWRSSILLAVGLAAFSVFVFVYLLSMPLPLVGSWFGE